MFGIQIIGPLSLGVGDAPPPGSASDNKLTCLMDGSTWKSTASAIRMLFQMETGNLARANLLIMCCGDT